MVPLWFLMNDNICNVNYVHKKYENIYEIKTMLTLQLVGVNMPLGLSLTKVIIFLSGPS